jgi:hypothetical protein
MLIVVLLLVRVDSVGVVSIGVGRHRCSFRLKPDGVSIGVVVVG